MSTIRVQLEAQKLENEKLETQIKAQKLGLDYKEAEAEANKDLGYNLLHGYISINSLA